MEIWLDSINLALIERAAKLGVLYGVTTNPSILTKSKIHPLDTLQMLLEVQEGPVAAQVIAEDAKGMIQQAEMFISISERYIAKIPVTQNGLEAIHYLFQHGIETMATCVYHPMQALLATQSGAGYIATYFSRIENDPLSMIRKMMIITEAAGAGLLAASVKTLDQVVSLMDLNIPAVTLKDEQFEELISDHPFTLDSLEQFKRDWNKSQ